MMQPPSCQTEHCPDHPAVTSTLTALQAGQQRLEEKVEKVLKAICGSMENGIEDAGLRGVIKDYGQRLSILEKRWERAEKTAWELIVNATKWIFAAIGAVSMAYMGFEKLIPH